MEIKIISPFKKVTCNFCFQKFHLNEAHIRDETPAGIKEPDEYVKQFLNISNAPDLYPVKESKNYLFNSFLLKSLDRHHNRICPHCHMPIPRSTASGEISSKTIAIIGGRYTGKSNYFAVLINELKHRSGNEVGFVVLEQDTFNTKEFKTVSSNKLFEDLYNSQLKQNQAIAATHPVGVNPQVRIPLIYRIKFKQRKFYEPKIIDLIFFDACGEDIEDKENIFSYYDYIFGASGIIFLIDPTCYQEVIDSLPPHLQSYISMQGQTKNPENIVEEVVSLFDPHVKKGVMEKKINIPVAFVLSKSDLLKDIVGEGSPIFDEPNHYKGVDEDDIDIVSEEVRDLISQWQSPRLIDLADSFFEEKKFFAVSALGALPDPSLNLSSAISPSRVTDPILWLFWKNKLISSMTEMNLSKPVKVLLEFFSTILIVLSVSNIVLNWKYLKAPMIYILASFIIGGNSCLMNKLHEFNLKNSIILCLTTIVFSLFISVRLLPVMNIFMLAWCTSVISQKFLHRIRIEQLSFIPSAQSGKTIVVGIYILTPLIIGFTFFNLI